MPELLTIGHSNRPLPEFLSLLGAHHVNLLADVRTVPRSGHNPQFNRDTLPGALAEAGIGYLHLPGLGGLRKPSPDSRNTGWRNLSFRGYADYMLTSEFERTLAELIQLAEESRVAIMCAESVPWRCHRADRRRAHGARSSRVAHYERRPSRTAPPNCLCASRRRAGDLSLPGPGVVLSGRAARPFPAPSV